MNSLTKGSIYVIVTLAFVVFATFRLTGTAHLIEGESSSPKIMEGDTLYGLDFLDPKRGEFSMWHCAKCGGAQVGKYTLAVPGDHLVIDGKTIYVNGEFERTASGSGFDQVEMTLKEDQYFVIGLNPNHSTDSRHLGVFSLEHHISRVVYHKKNSIETAFADAMGGNDNPGGW